MNTTAQKTSLEDFNTSIEDLRNRLRNDEEMERNHYGDYLMIQEEDEDEKYRVWLNHPENVSQGEPTAQIEYFGASNGYTWQTIAEFNEETVKKQFYESLNSKIQSAKDVFNANLKNIVKCAQEERKIE